jgi:predicted nucleic acid-binding protein
VGLTVLDAGVIVAALDASDIHHPACVEAVRRVQVDGEGLLLPASAFAECLVWPLRAGDAAAEQMEAFIDALPASVVAADRMICRIAARLRAAHGRSLRLPDALVIATAIETKATQVLTTDQGWPPVEVPIRVIAGSKPRRGRRPDLSEGPTR